MAHGFNQITLLTISQSSGQYPYFNFSNIRYSEAPVGNLRFTAPVVPKSRNSTINDGQQGVICPQAAPGLSGWSLS
jgi:carboxylesterase type B